MLQEQYNYSQRFEGLNVYLVYNDMMMKQYFTAPSFLYITQDSIGLNQEYYVFT